MNYYLKITLLVLTFIFPLCTYGQNASYSYEQQKILFDGDWEIHGENYYNDIKITVLSQNRIIITIRKTDTGSYFPSNGEIQVTSFEGKTLKFKIAGVKGWNYSTIHSVCFDEQELNFKSSQFTIIRTEDMLEYKTTTIKDQIWMTKNLNITKLGDGTKIKYISSDNEYYECERNKTPACCYYGYDPSNGRKYGMLYNYWALKGIQPPDGWRIPGRSDFEKLEKNVSGYNALLSRNSWQFAEDTYNSNSSGFNALPSGVVIGTPRNHFQLGSHAWWWTYDFTESDFFKTGTIYYISSNRENFFSGFMEGNMTNFCGIRCVKENKEYNKSPQNNYDDDDDWFTF